ncbi:hypothetical protein J2T21_004099, partial [Paeniglutamicibacter psychrophenolicus]|nr:hypothetical protein [Paeniglutamicibacter psychrophenolicus]
MPKLYSPVYFGVGGSPRAIYRPKVQ